MKNKIKKWHIALMSFMALFVAVFASLFSLRADTVDEETGEVLTDNWELSTVFYDSTVDNGLTPLTEIDWDASDGSYKEGTTRVITVQINYKNNSAVTTYQPGDLKITIPNLVYGTNSADSAQWTTSTVVGANDSTHTGYDWTTKASTANYIFTNTYIIEEKANFEGSIKIIYTITPTAEAKTGDYKIEKYDDFCIHNFSKELQATLEIEKLYEGTTITSPNWPDKYPAGMTEDKYFWEYYNENAKEIRITFDSNANTSNWSDYVYIYDRNDTELQKLHGTSFAGRTYTINNNYIKVTMTSTNSNSKYTGFSALISYKSNFKLSSNTISFNYTRTYTHPWQKKEYTLEKSAEKIYALDYLPSASEYIWVNYSFKISPYTYGSSENKYPNINVYNYILKDTIPEECIVFDKNTKSVLESNENNEYTLSFDTNSYAQNVIVGTNYCKLNTLIVGYPKSIYNEENQNLEITNTAYLYGLYESDIEYSYLSESSVTFNLSDFEFTYSGDLYGIEKSIVSGHNYLTYEAIIGDISSIDNKATNYISWELGTSIKYTGKPMNIKIGDDLQYIYDSTNGYRKLTDDEYYISHFYLPVLNDAYSNIVSYNAEIWVRYANESDYVLHGTYVTPTGIYNKEISFTGENKVVSVYALLKDVTTSILADGKNYNKWALKVYYNKQDIQPKGTIHNFDYLEVYIDNILVNNVNENNYSSMWSKTLIAPYDLSTYGHYQQRSTRNADYTQFNVEQLNTKLTAYKTGNNVVQNAEEEYFSTNFTIGNKINATAEYYSELKNMYSTDYLFKGFILYDLLPEGMEVTSTEEEILNSYVEMKESSKKNYVGFLNENFETLTQNDISTLIKNNTIITITENWKGTNRTLIKIEVNLTNNPFFIRNTANWTTGYIYPTWNYSCKITYDDYLEQGSVFNNYVYAESHNKNATIYNSVTDDGMYDEEALDINQNLNISEKLSYAKATTTITSVVSTHQDVTTYVKTDQSNYSTGIVDSSCNSEYEYKLRVRTGAADVTNLVIYTSIEEAQPKRTRWYGEFLGVDTTYAENKGYTVKIWYSSNKTVGTLTEDISWQVYDEATVDKSKVKSLAFQYLVEADDTTETSTDAITPATLPANSLTYVLIKMKSPADESLTTLARMDCWTEWNAIDEFSSVVDGITGINSNVVKVALPNSVKTDDLPSISLKFTKEIQGETSDFENLKLNKSDEHIFMIRLTNMTQNDDGTYNQVTGLLSSTQGLVITQIPIGTYLLEELGDNYFDFVEFTDNNDPEIIIEGVTFEQTDQGYIITVSEDLAETVEFNIKVTNKTEDKRFYEDKEYKENLFLKNKLEEDPI